MARYGIIGLLSCFYVAGAVLFIQSQGRAYRDALDRARQTGAVDPTVATSDPAQPPKPAAVTDVAPSAGSRPSPAASTTGPASQPPAQPAGADRKGPPAGLSAQVARPAPVGSVASTPPAASAGADRKGPPAGLSAQVARPAPVGSVASTPPAASAGDVRKSVPRPENIDPFWKQPFLTKAWDLDHFTAQDEKTLGDELNSVIVELSPPDDGPGRQRVIEATKQLLELRDRKDIEYKITILSSDIPNVFSHPGGFIYISRGLLDMIADDEDYLLEFIVGHEMAHVEFQHTLQCLKDPRVRDFTDGTLQKLYFLIIPHAYPKELEFAADHWVDQRMQRLGRSVHDRLAFLRKLDSYATANGFKNGQGKVKDLYRRWAGKPGTAPPVLPIENHLRAHKAAWERLDQLKELTQKATAAGPK